MTDDSEVEKWLPTALQDLKGYPKPFLRRLAACLSACQGLSTEALEDIEDVHDLYREALRETQRLQDEADELEHSERKIKT